MKGIPHTYAKDMQEDKEPLFDALETTQICLQVFKGVWETLKLREQRMAPGHRRPCPGHGSGGLSGSSGNGIQEAHHLVGNLVRQTMDAGRALTALEPEELRRHSDLFGEDVVERLNVRRSLELRNIEGGTGPQAVRRQLQQARALLNA